MRELLLSFAGAGAKPATVWTKLDVAGGPVGIGGQAVSVYKDDLYFVGGYDNVAANETAALYKYNQTSKAFTRLADMPTAMREHRCVMGIGKLYVWGGYSTALGYTTRFYIYTISNNTWTTGTLPATAADRPGSAQPMMVNVGSDIFILGGANGDAPANGTTNVMRYNMVTNVWTKCAAMANPIVNGSAIVQDDLIFTAFGVYNNGTTANLSISAYDQVLNTWTVKMADVVTNFGTRSGAKVMLMGDEIFYYGGRGANKNMSRYVPRTNIFTDDVGVVPDLMNSSESRGFKAKNKFYCLGSMAGTEMWVYDPYVKTGPPPISVIPFQEFYSGTEYCTLTGINGGTVKFEGLSWAVMRFNKEIWLMPLKPLMVNAPLGSSYVYNPGGAAKTVAGVPQTWYGPRNSNDGVGTVWYDMYWRIAKSYANNTATSLAQWSDNAVGFGTGGLFNVEWTTQENGAYDQWARGGNAPGNQGAALNKTSGRAGVRPMIKILATTFPW